ncbi:Hypothetical_protein [Hexamita inflata]|nr:Hypothetical protein HINF_LOCUS32258 [Hexamita inflata]
MDFKLLLQKTRDKIQIYPSSQYQIKVQNETFTLYRMQQQKFNTMYNQLIKNKTKAGDILEYLKPNNADISIPQLNMFIALYKTETTNKKQLIAKLQFINNHTVRDKQEDDNIINEKQFIQYSTGTMNIDQMNQSMKYIQQYDISYLIKNIKLQDQNIFERYIQILQQCQLIEKHSAVINNYLYTASQTIIPRIIYKSFQILINYPQQYKVINACAYIFQLPLCYLIDEERDISREDIDNVYPLIIDQNNKDIHLKTRQGKEIHKIISDQKDSNNIIHHINSNEFDNRLSNLVEITISEDEKQQINEYMKDKTYTQIVKHQYIHRILNFTYQPQFFNNALDLQYFEQNNTFYKVFINKHINNPQKMIYELINSIDTAPQYESQRLINHMINRIEREL